MNVSFRNRAHSQNHSPRRAALALVSVAAISFVSGCSGSPVSAEGTWGTTGEGEPQLVLEADGKLAGTDGCNRLVGTWEKNDDTNITFVDVASTMMACEDTDTWLLALDTGEIDGDKLTIKNTDGDVIGTLDRSGK